MGNACTGAGRKGSRHKRKAGDLRPLSEPEGEERWRSTDVSFLQRTYRGARGKQRELDLEAFAQIFPDLNRLPPRFAELAFGHFDLDRSGGVDFRDFCTSLLQCCLGSSEEKQARPFTMFGQIAALDGAARAIE